MLYFELTIWSIFYRRQNKILYLVGLIGIELLWENFWFSVSLSALGAPWPRRKWSAANHLACSGDRWGKQALP